MERRNASEISTIFLKSTYHCRRDGTFAVIEPLEVHRNQSLQLESYSLPETQERSHLQSNLAPSKDYTSSIHKRHFSMTLFLCQETDILQINYSMTVIRSYL